MKMSDRTVRSLLWLTTGCMISVGFLIMIAAMTVPLLGPLSPQVTRTSLPARKTPQDSAPDRLSMSVRDFEGIWGKPLQRPVQELEPPEVAPDPEPVAKVSTPKPQFSAKLIGTISDSKPELARAWIEVAGKPRLIRHQERLSDLPGEPVVAEIQPESILLELGDQQLEIELVDDNALSKREARSTDTQTP